MVRHSAHAFSSSYPIAALVSLLLLATGCSLDWSIKHLDGGNDADAEAVDVNSGNDAGLAETQTRDATANGRDAHAESKEPGAGADASDADANAAPPFGCYADEDHDGVGAGSPIACPEGTDAGVDDASLPDYVSLAGDCDDSDPQRSPSLSDICGDNIDNDCDGDVDEESNNVCGGACTAQLKNKPEEPCDNGLLGACKRTGVYECTSSTTTTCNAPHATASDEVCGDGVDNDCDGKVDEAGAVNALMWFVDCDKDGYSPSTLASVKACTKPPETNGCSWTSTIPVAKSTQDCDDTSAAYKPGAKFGVPPEGKTSTDLNCDGVSEREPSARVREWLGAPKEFEPIVVCATAPSCESTLHNSCVRWQLTAPTCSTGEADLLEATWYYKALDQCLTDPVKALQYCR